MKKQKKLWVLVKPLKSIDSHFRIDANGNGVNIKTVANSLSRFLSIKVDGCNNY